MFKRLMIRIADFLDDHLPEVVVILFLIIFLGVYFAPLMVYSLAPGEIGVIWHRFGGTVLNRSVGEGMQILWPWDKLYIYDTRLQQRTESFDIISADGLRITVEISYRFELVPSTVPMLQDFVGPDYVNVLVSPEIGAGARDVFARNTPEEIFSERRVQIKEEIMERVRNGLRENFNPTGMRNMDFVKLEDILIRSIKLPQEVEAAIMHKQEQEQLNEEYDYRLLREAKESERKRIEARGIKEFQDTVSAGITDSYLRWRGIEATLELARSPNAKVVVIGSGKGGLPIILGNMDDSKPGANPQEGASAGRTVQPDTSKAGNAADLAPGSDVLNGVNAPTVGPPPTPHP